MSNRIVHFFLKPLISFVFLFLFSVTHAQLVPIVFGDASDLGDNCYQITPDRRQQAGSVWYDNPIDLSADFTLRFRANFGTKDGSGADGIAFVLKENSNPEIGNPGAGIGYQGISPSVIVEFDTWRNGFFVDPTFADHIAISTNGANTNNIAGPVQASAAGPNIEDGDFHNVKIEWLANTNTLTISFDCVERISTSTDFVSSVFSGNPIVYFGFTGSTGNSSNEHTVCYDNITFASFLENKTICSGNDITTIDATTNGATTYSWTPTTGVSDPNSPNPIFTPLATTTYTVEISDICGEKFIDNFIATVNPKANPGTDGALSICDSGAPVDLFTLLGGTPDNGGTWTPALTSGNGIFDPTVDTSGTYTYSVSGIAPCTNDSANVIVSIENSPNSGVDGTIVLCSNDNVIDLFTVLSGNPDNGGTWSPALNSGNGVFDPSVDVADTYTYSINSTGCNTVSSEVIVSVNLQGNAGEDSSLSICDSGAPVDLFTFLGGTPDNGGTWTPALTSGSSIFDPTVDTPGTYTYSVSGIAPCTNDSANVVVSVENSPNSGADGAITLCSNDNAIDLFTVLSGNPDNGGTWSPSLNSGNGVFDPNIDVAGTYTYTISSSGCNATSSEVIVSVNPQVNAGEDGTLSICDSGTPVNLFTLLGGTPDNGGTWTPPLNSGNGVFDPTVDTSGTYIYTVSGIAPCTNGSANVIVSVENSPSAGENNTLSICSTGMPIDLFTFLGGSPNTGGTWTPPLNSNSSIFDPTIDNAGTYTYTVTGIAPCTNDSANIIVTLTNSPSAGDDANIVLCANDNATDLFTLLGGTPDAGGTWTPPLTSGTSLFDPSIDSEGIYTYTINNPGCLIDEAQIVITINQIANAGEDATLSICASDNSINLFTLLGGNPDNGGSWVPPLANGTGVFDPSIDTPGLYTYSVNGIAPCTSDSSEVLITLNAKPDALQPGDIIACDDDNDNTETFDLEQQTSLITADNINYRASFHRTQIDANNNTNRIVGPYNNTANPQTIYTRVEDITNGCVNTSVNFDLILNSTVVAISDSYELCNENIDVDNDTTNDSAIFNLQSRNPIILGPNQNQADYTVTYHLTLNDANNSLNALPSNYENTINPQVIFVRVENNTTNCFSTSDMRLLVNPLPLISLEDKYVLCIDSSGEIILPLPVIDTGLENTTHTFEWYLNGALINGETNSSIEPSLTGTYSVLATNNNTGCSFTANTLVIESTPPSLELQQVSITFVENNEVLAVATNNGSVNSFYEFSIDGGLWVSNNSNNNTYLFENVTAGEHTITVRDINGCGETSATITLLDFKPYFTPNGDGYNDFWNIHGIENQPDAIIYIFDRYGKLMKQLSPIGKGWDGTYNNNPLPTNDYWFSLEYKDPNTKEQRNFKSHFTLKR